jgi:hypothetical protein
MDGWIGLGILCLIDLASIGPSIGYDWRQVLPECLVLLDRTKAGGAGVALRLGFELMR